MKYIKKIVTLMVAAVFAISVAFSVGAETFTEYAKDDYYDLDEIFKNSVTAKDSVKYSEDLQELYQRLMIKASCNNDGELVLKATSNLSKWNVDLVCRDGTTVKASKCKVTTGYVSYDDNNNLAFEKDYSGKDITATITYKVKKGDYIIILANMTGRTGIGSVTVSYPSSIGTCLTISMKAGTSLDLSADGSGLSWTSSKKSVATVSSVGRVSAKKAGTSLITVTDGKKKLYIKIKVKS